MLRTESANHSTSCRESQTISLYGRSRPGRKPPFVAAASHAAGATIMKPSCFAAVLVYLLHGINPPASAPPRLTVGTSYPDTQLILPWFLNDIIDFVNYH
jgi:hypothetical protein